MEKQYFYTNEMLGFCLKCNLNGQVNWEENGMSVKDVCKHQFQAERNGILESLIPIADKTKFNLALGNLIALGKDTDGTFYRVVNQKEYDKIKAELEELNKPKEV